MEAPGETKKLDNQCILYTIYQNLCDGALL